LSEAAIYAGLFAAAFLAATILPASSEVALGGLIASGQGEPFWLLLTATAGNVLGSGVNWVLGRFLAEFRDRRWFPVDAARYDRASRLFRRWGSWSLLFAWVPVIGDPLTLVAGALRVGLVRFLVLVTIGKASRYIAVMAAAGFWAGS